MLFLIAATLWAKANALANEVLEDISSSDKYGNRVWKVVSWNDFERKYTALKKLSKLIGGMYGTRITLSLVKIVLYYAVVLKNVTTLKMFMYQLVYITQTVGFVVMAADIGRQVQKYSAS